MDTSKMMWAVFVTMEGSMWDRKNTDVFDDDVWNEIISECVATGMNTIVLDIGRGIEFGSHPELAQPWAWSREKVRGEVKRLKALGIELIPKLNFSATHDGWLCEYERMLSTPTYYRVCRDLILEAGALFDHPRYIHIGMDEEDARHAAGSELAVYRHKELYWHDLQYLCDCVRDAGSTPWIWSCPCIRHPEEFRAHVKTDDIVLSPWMYNALRRDHWTSINSRQAYIDYYAKEPYASMNIQFVEEEPYPQMFMKEALPCVNDGYQVVPCVSSINQCQYNAVDMLEYFKENADPKLVLGYLTAPWQRTLAKNREPIINEIRWFRQAIDEIYHGIKIDEKDRVNVEYDKIATESVY